MKTITPTFETAQNKLNVRRFKEVELYRRYWDSGTDTYKKETTAFDLTPYLLKVGKIKWKLDTEALNEWKTSNVTITLKNTDNYFDEENSSGIWNDGGTFLANRSEVRIKVGVYNVNGVKESLYVFTGYITQPPVVYHDAPTAQITIRGKEVVLEDVDAENLSKRPYMPRDDYRYENATTFSSTTIGKTGAGWTVNEHQYAMVRIYSGTGRGQERYILSNTATVLTVQPAWVTTPDATSDFEIFGENLGQGTGALATFYTTNIGVGAVIDVWVDSVKMKQGVDYQVSQLNDETLQALITFETGSIPGAGERVTGDYKYWYQNQKPEWIVEELLKLAGFTASEYIVDPVIMPNNVRVEWLQDTQGDFQNGWYFQDISTTKQAGFLRIDHIPISEWRTYWERHAEYILDGIYGDIHWSRDVDWVVDYQLHDGEGDHWWRDPYNSDMTRLRNEHCGWRYGQNYFTADSRWIEFNVKDTQFLEPRWRYLEFAWVTNHPADPTTIPAMSVETNVSDTGVFGGEEEGWVAATAQSGEYPYKWDINSAQKRYMKVRIKFTGAGAAAYVNQNYILDYFRAYFFPWGETHSEIRDCSNVLVAFGKLYATDDDGLAVPIPDRFIKYYTRFTPTPYYDADVTDADIFSSTTIGDTGESWTTDEHKGKIVEIYGGTGSGQFREISSNTGTTLTVSSNWSVTPDATSDFRVHQWSPWALVPANQQIDHTSGYWVAGTSRFLQVKTEMQTDEVKAGSPGDVFPVGGGDYPRVDDILVDYYTSTFSITMANMTGLTAWDAIKQLAKMVDYEIGVSADGKFFFRQKRNTIASADLEVFEDDRLYKVSDKRIYWDRVKNVIKVTYGNYTKTVSPETELEDPPHSITKYGERIFEVSGGNLLAPPDHDLALGLALNYFGIYDVSQNLVSHKYPEPRDGVRIKMKFLPRLDLSDAVLVRKTKPGDSANRFIDDEIYVILGMSLDVEKWEMEAEALQPYGN